MPVLAWLTFLSRALSDFFRGEVLPKINLASLDHVIVCTAVDKKIYFRYNLVLFCFVHIPRADHALFVLH